MQSCTSSTRTMIQLNHQIPTHSCGAALLIWYGHHTFLRPKVIRLMIMCYFIKTTKALFLWKGIKWEAYTTHKCAIFLYCRPGKIQGSANQILSYWDHHCWLFDQITAWIIVLIDVRHDHKKYGDRFANRWGSQFFSQEWNSSGVNPRRMWQECVKKQERQWCSDRC